MPIKLNNNYYSIGDRTIFSILNENGYESEDKVGTRFGLLATHRDPGDDVKDIINQTYLHDRKTGGTFDITSEFGKPYFSYLGEAGDRAYFKVRTRLYFRQAHEEITDTCIAVLEDHKVIGYINDPPIKKSKEFSYWDYSSYLQSDGNFYALVQDKANLKAYLYKLGMSKTRRNTLWDAIAQFGTPEPTENRK